MIGNNHGLPDEEESKKLIVVIDNLEEFSARLQKNLDECSFEERKKIGNYSRLDTLQLGARALRAPQAAERRDGIVKFRTTQLEVI